MADPVNRASVLDQIQSFSDFDMVMGTCLQDRDKSKVFSSIFWKFCNNSKAYFTEIPKRDTEVTLEEAKSSLQQIPDEEIYPELPQGTTITVATQTSMSQASVFVKRPPLADYGDDPDHSWIRDIFLAEALIMERISKAPHKNLVRYYGCLLGDNRVKGIVLERHERTLLTYFQCGDGPLDDDAAFMAELESAVYHLHSLGLAHNDIKPSNIMLNEEKMPVLIDFGSCQPFGARLLSGGTLGWFEEQFNTSASEHDLVSLRLMRTWLANPDRRLTC